MDIERVNRIDSQGKNLLGIFLARAGGSSQNGHVDVFEFTNVFHYLVGSQFCRFVFCTVAAHDARNLEVGRSLKGLNGVLADVAVTNDGCSDFFHVFNSKVCFCGANLHLFLETTDIYHYFFKKA